MKKSTLLYISLISSGSVILYEFSKWRLVDFFTVFFQLPIVLTLYFFFIVMTVITIIALIKHRNWKPVLIQLVTVIALFLIPFDKITLDNNFQTKLADRQEIIEMIAEEELLPNVSYNESLIRLPDSYRNLSSGGGEVVMEETDAGLTILFFTFRGVMDNFSGFVYVQDGGKPPKDVFGNDTQEITKIQDNWYYLESF